MCNIVTIFGFLLSCFEIQYHSHYFVFMVLLYSLQDKKKVTGKDDKFIHVSFLEYMPIIEVN